MLWKLANQDVLCSCKEEMAYCLESKWRTEKIATRRFNSISEFLKKEENNAQFHPIQQQLLQGTSWFSKPLWMNVEIPYRRLWYCKVLNIKSSFLQYNLRTPQK